jgi:hypothetical protein
LALNGVLVSAVVSPWLYAVARFHEVISIAESFKRIGPLIFDVWWQRLAPFPLDVRTLERATGISTPYLETQTNTVLFLLALVVLGAAAVNRKSTGWLKPSGAWLACFGLLGFLCLFAFSVWTVPVDFLSPLQFLYRLVTYQNIAILLFLFGSLLLLNKRTSFSHLCSAAIAVAGLAVLIKFVHVQSIPVSDSSWQTRQQVRSLPSGFYNSGDYAVKKGFKDLVVGMPWPPIEITPQGDIIGDTPTVSIAPQKPSTVVFHVLLFPWHKVFVDGSPRNPKATMAFFSRPAFVVQPGTHSVRYAFEPDSAWLLFK